MDFDEMARPLPEASVDRHREAVERTPQQSSASKGHLLTLFDKTQPIYVDNIHKGWKRAGAKLSLSMLKPTLFNAVSPKPLQRWATHLAGLPLPWVKGVAFRPTSPFELPVPGYLFTPRQAAEERALLYLHGGNFELGVTVAMQKFAARLAKALNIKVYLPRYRLSPKHTCQDSFSDCYQSMMHLFHRYQPNHVQLLGEGCGAGLLVSSLLKARARAQRLPEKMVLISPWLDFSCGGSTFESNLRKDPIVSQRWLQAAFDRKRARVGKTGAQGVAREASLSSPLKQRLSGLPHALIMVARDELLLSDALSYAEGSQACGAAVRLEVWEGLWHCWPLYGFLPESGRALKHIVNYIGYQEREMSVFNDVRSKGVKNES